LNKLEICVSIIAAIAIAAIASALKRVEALAIADYRSPRNATRSRNGNKPLDEESLWPVGQLDVLKSAFGRLSHSTKPPQ